MVSPKYPCGICHKNVNINGIFCDKCNFWHHFKRNDISVSEYEALSNEPDDVPWFCINCSITHHESIFPFGSIENKVLSNLFDFDKPSVVDSLPSLEITSRLTNLPNLQDYDIDEHLPSNIDSSYHTIQELSNYLETSPTDLSFLHMNIQSLSCHFDELLSLLTNLNIGFGVVAVSETWNTIERPITMNVTLPGYTFLSSKSQSQNGAVGLYIKTSLNPVPRPDLQSAGDEYETIWAELETSREKNILICCAYRHPNTEIEHFIEYIQSTLSNPTVANKQVFILGDFNINLLNYDTHTPTNNFVSLLLSQHFLPFIIHPTRVSNHSSTIIDNIFSNVCNLDTKSGKILTQIADHFPQFLTVKRAGTAKKTLSYYKYDYSKFDKERFLIDFNNLDFEYLNANPTDVNAKYKRLLANVNDHVSKHAPLKKLTKRDLKLRSKPWVNSRIQKMMHLEDGILKKLRQKPVATMRLL